MKSTNLLVAALAGCLPLAGIAFCQPPDTLPHSPIPPLRPKVAGAADPAESKGPGTRPAATTGFAPTPGLIANGSLAPSGAPTTNAKQQVAANDYAERLAIWTSPEMVEARAFVLEYSERSARSSRKEGEQFLARVSQLSPTEMSAWLERLQSRRADLARQRDATAAARQMSLEQAAQRIQEARQSHANINQWQSLSAQFLQERLRSQQALTQQRQSYRDVGRSAALAGQRIYFDPFAPTLDPVSPSRLVRAAAAASLPEGVDPSDGDAAPTAGPATTAAQEAAGPPESGE